MDYLTRTELKYKISASAFKALNAEFSPYLVKDKYYFQKIHTVYYDNEHDESICRSLEKPIFKEKLRVRAYENDGELYPYAFIEQKKKYDGIVYKRRQTLPLDRARELLRGGSPYEILGDGQVAREILFFLEKTSCRPKQYLSYDRYSFRGRFEEDLRITFDANVVSRAERLDFVSEPSDRPLLEAGRYLMEIKAGAALPLWLTGILTKHKIYPAGFTKYGRIFEQNTAYKLSGKINYV